MRFLSISITICALLIGFLTPVTAADVGAVPPEKKLVGLEINKTNIKFKIQESVQLSATAKFSDGTTQDVTHDTEWTSNNSVIAHFSSDIQGLLHANTAGTTKATASFQGINKPIYITVTKPSTYDLKAKVALPTKKLQSKVGYHQLVLIKIPMSSKVKQIINSGGYFWSFTYHGNPNNFDYGQLKPLVGFVDREYWYAPAVFSPDKPGEYQFDLWFEWRPQNQSGENYVGKATTPIISVEENPTPPPTPHS